MPAMLKTQVAETGPLVSPLTVSVTPKKTSVLPCLMMPRLSPGKMLRLSSASENGIVADTPRWYFWKPSPAEPNASVHGFA